MTIIDELLQSAQSAGRDLPVQDVLVGLYWTAVHARSVGLAATPSDITCCDASDVANAGHLHERSALDLAALVRSTHPLEVSIGMAALNALIPVDERAGVELNARDLLVARGRGKNVATVGHFPFTDALRTAAARLWVLELNPGTGDQPAEAAPDLLPQADVIGLTASTLLNGTFENLCRWFPPGALVVMLGPSTPLSPVLFDYGVHVLGGVRVHDPGALLRYVGQGSSIHRVPGMLRFTLVKDRALAGEGGLYGTE